MKQFFAFVKKEFYHILRDKRTILILLGIPILQILLFGFAISTETKNIQLAVYDASKDIETQSIIEKFKAGKYFNLVEVLNSPDQINDVFKYGKISAVLVFGENFADNLYKTAGADVQIVVDGTEPNQASTIAAYATNILASYQQELLDDGKVSFQIVPSIKMLYNPQMKSAYNFVPGVMGLIMILICAMMTSITIVREKEMGTMEVLLASPLKPIYIIMAKMVPYFVLSVVNLATILLLAVFVLNVPITGSLFWLICLSLTYIILALALGLFVSNLVDNQMAAMLASGMGFMMPVIILSGMIFPVESMPNVLQWISCIIPARWYIEGVKKLMIQGVELRFVAKEFLILGSMAIVMIAISLKKFKTRLN